MPADERLSTLVLSEADFSLIGACLERLLEDSAGICAMLIDVSGMLLGWRGTVPAQKAETLGVLLANGFVAAKQVAALLGQPQFEAFLQQGKHQNILSEAVGNNWILVTIFQDRTSEGMIRLLSGRACKQLMPTLQRVRAESAARGASAGPRLGGRVVDALDDLFKDMKE